MNCHLKQTIFFYFQSLNSPTYVHKKLKHTWEPFVSQNNPERQRHQLVKAHIIPASTKKAYLDSTATVKKLLLFKINDSKECSPPLTDCMNLSKYIFYSMQI